MNEIQIAFAHTREQVLEHVRAPGYLVTLLGLPLLFFLLVSAPQAESASDATFGMIAYAMWAVMAVAFFQFGVGISVSRTTPWETLVRTLPVGPEVRLVGRIGAGVAFALVAAGLVVAAGLLFTDAVLPVSRLPPMTLALLGGGLAFALGGIALGYWATPRAANGVAILAWVLPMYAGGLWFSPQGLPSWVREIQAFVPTRVWVDLLQAAAAGPSPFASAGRWLVMAGYAVAFGALASWGYRRDEGIRYR